MIFFQTDIQKSISMFYNKWYVSVCFLHTFWLYNPWDFMCLLKTQMLILETWLNTKLFSLTESYT